MRILVLSDTHRSLNKTVRLLHDIADDIDMVIHLGDNTEDAAFIKNNYQLPVLNVAGNCDFDASVPDDRLEQIGGKTVFMTHGHRYGVKYGSADDLVYRALELGADICLFGHTHTPFLQVIRGIVVMNPGSLPLPRGGSKPCYGIIKIEDGEIYPALVEIKN
ncbi:MAG: metallophosphoesterase [Firmicutes bacterium]|nr:metallophosphoesterase [Bacillota bacterium]